MPKVAFKKLFIATKNVGKIVEFEQILRPLDIEILSTADIIIPDVNENGITFAENAKIKADSAKNYVDSETAIIADDSGLCVSALNGNPGVFSARYAEDIGFDAAMAKILTEISKIKTVDRSAYFCCVLHLILPIGIDHVFEGRVDGMVTSNKRGDGFGYDPIFLPNGYSKTFGEMSKYEKNKISHRAIALQKFQNWLDEMGFE